MPRYAVTLLVEVDEDSDDWQGDELELTLDRLHEAFEPRWEGGMPVKVTIGGALLADGLVNVLLGGASTDAL
jgi:hypothetical protein